MNEIQQKLIPAFIKGIKKYTAENPIKSDEIEAGLTEYAIEQGLIESGDKIRGTDIRMIVSFLCTNYIPVGSGQEGYYWARNEMELMPSIRHISSRAFKLVQRMHKMHLAVYDEAKQEEVIRGLMSKDVGLFEEV